MNKKSTLALAVSALLAAHCGLAFADLESVRTFDIPPQPLASALLQFSNQADVQVVGSSNSLTDLATPGINGRYTGSEALRRLIGGNPVNFEAVTSRSVRILPQGDERANKADAQFDRQTSSEKFQRTSVETSANAASSATSPTVRLAQGAASPESEQGSAEANNPTIRLEEVIVTGSHIRGAQNLSSPVIRFDREDIERSGYATTQQLIQKLPQNLNNISDMTFGGINGGADLTYNGSGVNLRGLGSDASLVLLNGRRMAPIGQGSFVDVSLIPLSAIERVEVLTDGASAIYGSDAVGGVVNMVLRRDFDGAETRLRYGSVTEGSYDELQAGQALGHTWDSGQALVSYEYHRQTALDATDRDFYKSVGNYNALKLIPEQTRQGALAVLSQQLSERVELSTELFFGQREASHGYQLYSSWEDVDTKVSQHGGSLGLNVDLGRNWQGRMSGQFDASESESLFFSGTGDLNTMHHNESRLWSVDLAADGPIGRAPGGDIRLALGGHFRDERFDEEHSFGAPALINREVSAAYAEVIVPWVSAANSRAGLQQLQLTLAGRYENYSDFGGTFNPKVGLAWSPVRDLNVRGTWGTSFKAPLLRQLNAGNAWGFVYTGSFTDASGPVPTLLLNGYGLELGPEESTNWTMGFDFTPAAFERLELSATYFRIDYEDRVRTPFPSNYDTYGVLNDPKYATVVNRSPDPAEVAALLARLNPYCFTPDWDSCTPEPADIRAIVDERYRNLAGVRMSGLDFSIHQAWDSSLGQWRVGLSGTRLLENVEQIVRGMPEVSQMNEVWRPVDLRLRSSVSFARGPLNAVAFVNYTDSYRDKRTHLVGPSGREVASWTTVDLSVQYDVSQVLAGKGLEKASLVLTATNLLDRDPPYVVGNVGINFDGVNANPLGRFVAAQVTVKW